MRYKYVLMCNNLFIYLDNNLSRNLAYIYYFYYIVVLDNDPVYSLHKNQQRVKEIMKKYAAGLIWTDGQRCGVDWLTLHPTVVVNRFPRDGNGPFRLCGPAMTGNPEFNDYYPRAYRATAVDDIVGDYSLTACVSLMRAFVDGIDNGSVMNCTKNRQVCPSVPTILYKFSEKL